jgi:SAM-dependent methyltransferase
VSSLDPSVNGWLAALERRHLAELTFSEVTRALRALSSCYVERRARLSTGAALDSRGKRAAFALFYGPLHFCVAGHIIRALDARPAHTQHVVDLGCGTGTAGAAWAIQSGARVSGSDRNAWAVSEANWTYRELGLRGRALRGDAARFSAEARAGTGVMLAYVVNELADDQRTSLLASLLTASRRGARVLVIEPISRRIAPWWSDWEGAFTSAGGRADEWRFPSDLPQRQRDLARAAGLDPRELTARSLWL